MKKLIILLLLGYSLTSCKSEPRKLADKLMEEINDGTLQQKFFMFNRPPIKEFTDLIWLQDYYENDEIPKSKDSYKDWFTIPEGIIEYDFIEEKESVSDYHQVNAYSRSDWNDLKEVYKTYEEFVASEKNIDCKNSACRDYPDRFLLFYKRFYPKSMISYTAFTTKGKIRVDMLFIKNILGWRCGLMAVTNI